MRNYFDIARVVFEKNEEGRKITFFHLFSAYFGLFNKVAGLTGMKFPQKYTRRAILRCRKAVRNFIEIGRVVFEKIEKGRKISNF